MTTRKPLVLTSGLFEELNTPTDKLDLAGNTTTDLTEGTNLYYTDARARGAISVTDAGGAGSLSYNSGTGVITYTGPSDAEIRGLFSATNSGTGFGSLAYDNSTGVFTYSVVTAANIRQQISVTDTGGDGSLSYDNTTGVITYTGPSGTDVRSYFSVAAGSGLTYNSSTGEFGTSAIPNAQLANSTITFGATAVSLGSTVTGLVLTDLTANTRLNVGGGLGASNTITIEANKIIYEGATADPNQTTIEAVDPTADRTITFPDASGTVALLTSLSVAAGSGLTYNSTTGEFGTSAIPNAQLANSSITLGSTSVALGTTATSIAGLTSITSTTVSAGTGVTQGTLVAAGQGILQFADSDSSNYVAFQAPATVTSNVTWTLPSTDAAVSGYALVSDAAGTLSWAAAGGGATGGGSDKVFFENDQTVTTNYTITAGKNAMSAGPITINSGVTVTVPSGSNWVIV